MLFGREILFGIMGNIQIFIKDDLDGLYKTEVSTQIKVGELVRDFLTEMDRITPGEQSMFSVFLITYKNGETEKKPLKLESRLVEGKIRAGDTLLIMPTLSSNILTDLQQKAITYAFDKLQETGPLIRGLLIYLPDRGIGQKENFIVNQTTNVQDLILYFLKNQLQTEEFSPEVNSFKVICKENQQLLKSGVSLQEAQIEESFTLIIAEAEVIKKIVPFIDFFKVIPNRVILHGIAHLLEWGRAYNNRAKEMDVNEDWKSERERIQLIIVDFKLCMKHYKLLEAIEKLLELNLNDKTEEEVYQLAGGFDKLKREDRKTKISYENYQTQFNRIFSSLFELGKEIEKKPFVHLVLPSD